MSSEDAVPGTVESTQWHRVDGVWLRILRFAPDPGLRGVSDSSKDVVADRAAHGVAPGVAHPAPQGAVLLIPGLGLPRYLLPLARLQAAHGVETLVVDALAWRGRGRRATPTIAGLAAVTAAWLQRREAIGTSPLAVVGHSTAAQVALETVLLLQQTRGHLALVMAGPTFQPDQRSLRGLVPAALTAFWKDTPKELVVVRDIARVRTDLVRIVQSARRHRPEERVTGLHVPLTVTAGEADSFATRPWLDLLARRAGAPGRAVVLPGSHNNLFTHRAEFGALVMEALRAAEGRAADV